MSRHHASPLHPGSSRRTDHDAHDRNAYRAGPGSRAASPPGRFPEIVATDGWFDQAAGNQRRRSAGVSRPSVLRGRSLRSAAMAFRGRGCVLPGQCLRGSTAAAGRRCSRRSRTPGLDRPDKGFGPGGACPARSISWRQFSFSPQLARPAMGGSPPIAGRAEPRRNRRGIGRPPPRPSRAGRRTRGRRAGPAMESLATGGPERRPRPKE